MGLLDIFKKKEKGALPPPPPPSMGGKKLPELPPLENQELEAPPAPVMPTAPAPAPLPKPIPVVGLKEAPAPIAEVPELPEPKVVEQRYAQPVQDPTLNKPIEDFGTLDLEEPAAAPAAKRLQVPEVPPMPEPAPHPIPSMVPPPRFVRKEIAKAPQARKMTAELFVSVQEYEDLLGSIEKVQSNLEESERVISNMAQLKTTEEEILEEWRVHLEDVEKKLSYVDQIIFEGE